MRKKIVVVFVALLLNITILSGCWSKKDLNELAIVTAIGIDKMEDGYSVSIQILNPSELAGKQVLGELRLLDLLKQVKPYLKL